MLRGARINLIWHGHKGGCTEFKSTFSVTLSFDISDIHFLNEAERQSSPSLVTMSPNTYI